LFEVERLLQIIECSQPHCFDGDFDGIVCRDENDFGFVRFCFDGFEDFDAAVWAFEHQVGDDDIEVLFFDFC